MSCLPIRVGTSRQVFAVLILVTVCSFIGVVPPRATAQTKQEANPCSAETTTAGMRNCANLRYERAEQALDKVYAQLLKKLDEPGKKKLRAAQAAWVKFRQADAEFEADLERGGTFAPLIKTTVMADLTEARTAELQKSLQP